MENIRDKLSTYEINIVANSPTKIDTDIDRWSDFSFSRYATGDINFDKLKDKQERYVDVGIYLAKIEEIIAKRNKNMEQGTGE